MLVYPLPFAAVSLSIYTDGAFFGPLNQPTDTFVAFDQRLFPIFDRSIHALTKSGLGSSAAITVVLVSALLSFFMQPESPDPVVIFQLACSIHCTFQGKVGSGFDISTALYGSQLFQRDTSVSLLSHPKGQTQVILAQTSCSVGSKTAPMVTSLTKWLDEHASSLRVLWRTANSELISAWKDYHSFIAKGHLVAEMQDFSLVGGTEGDATLSTLYRRLRMCCKVRVAHPYMPLKDVL